MSTAPEPAELAALTEREAELTDLYGAMVVLGWDQGTYMPPGGAATRGDVLAGLERIAHGRLVDPEVGRLLDRLEPWAEGLDPDGDVARRVRVVRRDFEKAVRVPAELAADMARESALGQAAWLKARETGELALFRDALARQVDQRHRYAACFPEAAHPYDVLLDDYEPGLASAELLPLFAGLVEALAPVVAAAGTAGRERNDGVFSGPLTADVQRAAIVSVIADMGFDPERWRLDVAPHPFAQSPGPGDYRITTRYREDEFGSAFYGTLHELGHGLYEEGLDTALYGTLLHGAVSLGIHESQSRTWENLVGRGRPFLTWVLPKLQDALGPVLDGVDARELYRAVNCVSPSPIRTDADEATYNLHIALRFDLEYRLFEGSLDVDDLSEAWAEGMERLLGVEVRSAGEGVLQDIHWAQGSFGYFPTYTLGNLIAAQMWRRAEADLGDLEGAIERGDFAPLREWLREHVHRHGRKFPPRELLQRVTGEGLSIEPFMTYLRDKLLDSGVLGAGALQPR